MKCDKMLRHCERELSVGKCNNTSVRMYFLAANNKETAGHFQGIYHIP